MFTEVIVDFNKRLDSLQKAMDHVITLLMELFNQVEDQKTLVKIGNKKADDTAKKFAACANGFYQTRDACELLRVELSTASGTMIENSWHNAEDCGLGGGGSMDV